MSNTGRWPANDGHRPGPGEGTRKANGGGAVTVLGSVNLDLVVRAPQHPGPGQTVLGTDYEEVIGGKGLNQAVASARTTRTTLLAAIGTDDAAERVIHYLERRNVDASPVLRVAGPTGRAVIVVTPDGENSIVVAPLANALLDQTAVTAVLDRTMPAVLLLQREIPPAVLQAAMRWAQSTPTRVVYNPSPVENVESRELDLADVLVVNLHEARALTGSRDAPAGPKLAEELVERHRCATVLTAGQHGAWVSEREKGTIHVPALEGVRVVDTTGAGDEFAGTLAATLALGQTLDDAVRLATAAAGRIVATSRRDR